MRPGCASRSALLRYNDRRRVCQGLVRRLDLLALLELDQLLLDAPLLRVRGWAAGVIRVRPPEGGFASAVAAPPVGALREVTLGIVAEEPV